MRRMSGSVEFPSKIPEKSKEELDRLYNSLNKESYGMYEVGKRPYQMPGLSLLRRHSRSNFENLIWKID